MKITIALFIYIAITMLALSLFKPKPIVVETNYLKVIPLNYTYFKPTDMPTKAPLTKQQVNAIIETDYALPYGLLELQHHKETSGRCNVTSHAGALELCFLTEAIYFEARGESKEGQFAVASVILNRKNSKYFPNTIKEVVNQPYQFSYTLNSREVKDIKSWSDVEKVAKLALNSKDKTKGALYYYNPKKVSSNPTWVHKKYYTRTIGEHKFYSWHRLSK